LTAEHGGFEARGAFLQKLLPAVEDGLKLVAFSGSYVEEGRTYGTSGKTPEVQKGLYGGDFVAPAAGAEVVEGEDMAVSEFSQSAFIA